LDASGIIFSISTLENYLEENGVKWHRDQVYTTIHYKDKEKTKRVIKTDELLSSWAEIIKAIPSWCLDLIKKPRFSPDDLTYPSTQRSKIPTPSQVLVIPRGEWFIVFPRGYCPATRDWRGRAAATAGSEHTVPPEDAEIAAKWGNGYHHAKRTSFPVASEFSSEGDDTPLDRITIQKLTYIISKKARSPPTCMKKWPEALANVQGGYTPDWPTIASL
jgi:hypothetical protein